MSDLKTEQQSLVFVKRMMAVAVSSITYLRGIFPEGAYRSRYLEGEHGHHTFMEKYYKLKHGPLHRSRSNAILLFHTITCVFIHSKSSFNTLNIANTERIE